MPDHGVMASNGSGKVVLDSPCTRTHAFVFHFSFRLNAMNMASTGSVTTSTPVVPRQCRGLASSGDRRAARAPAAAPWK